jgi:hypothetical protein
MHEVLNRLSGEELVGGLAILSALAIVVVAIVATQWRWARESRLRAELLADMLRRGLGPDDIERLLQQAPGTCSRSAGLNDPGVEAQIAVELARQVSDPQSMEEAMRAVHPADLATKRAILDAVHEMADNESDQRVIVAVVQSLCQSSGQRRLGFRDEAPLKHV